MITLIRPVVVSIFLFTLLMGVLYPLAITGIAQVVFPFQANGSMLVQDGKPDGSGLIGQPFDDPKYFWGRLSATAPFPYNSAVSAGSNMAQTNPDLLKNAQARIDALRSADKASQKPVPVDLVTASGSGLDPHISPAAAEYQIKRIAQARNLDENKLKALVQKHTEDRQFGILGEPRVNVLLLNRALQTVK